MHAQPPEAQVVPVRQSIRKECCASWLPAIVMVRGSVTYHLGT